MLPSLRALDLLKWTGKAYLAAIGVKLLYLWAQTRRVRKVLENVPSCEVEDSTGFLGFLTGLGKNLHRQHDWFEQGCRKFDVCKALSTPFSPKLNFVLCLGPEHVKHVLKDNFANYDKPGREINSTIHYLHDFLRTGIFNAKHTEGSDDQGYMWRLQRKIATGIFNRSNFNNNMLDVFSRKSERLCMHFDKVVAKGGTMDLQEVFHKFTMDSIMEIFFGVESDAVGGGSSDLGDAFQRANSSLYLYGMKNMGVLGAWQLLPWPLGCNGGLLWKIHAAMSPLHREFRKGMRICVEECSKLVQACREDPNLEQRDDLLARFMKADGKLSNDALRDIVINLIIAGRDTTAVALSWLFFEIANNPDVLERLLTEVDAKCPPGTTLSTQSLSHKEMPYLHGIIYESLRLHPPVPIDGKEAIADDVFPDGTRVPAGVLVNFFPYAMARNPALYPEPLAFRPERWIPFKQPQPHEFPVFQAGPRLCLGMDMAIFEMKVVTAILFRQFRFDLAPGEAENLTYSPQVTMSIVSKTDGVPRLMMVPRKRGAA